MALADYKIRILGNACITRYTKGEGDITVIVDSYNPSADDKELILDYIYIKRPELKVESEVRQ
ncbi:hypothetical protein [Paenibacillus chitinolyticus]|uniref:hypothetical protein n=1 Tax=Paenibacillus chitinolyticus TaxID=79263 RepID=UPI003D029FA9